MSDKIMLAHGSGGKLTHKLIGDIFRKHFSNDILNKGDDSAVLAVPQSQLAFTTDSFVVSPLFFKGGNIGKLAVCGTVNDLAAAGAEPLYISAGFIIEEGFRLEELEAIVSSMAETARAANVRIVTGDTKVVQRGAADGIFINTSGIGVIPDGINISGSNARPGDKVIVTGTLGDHGCAILLEREKLNISSPVQSDCAPLNGLINEILKICKNIHVLRDPTRGGLATTLNEIAAQSCVGITLYENSIPVKDEVRGVCELLGMDPLYMANEGKMIVILPAESADAVLEKIKSHPFGTNARIIGDVTDKQPGRVIIKTITGGSRILDMLSGDQLPRIC